MLVVALLALPLFTPRLYAADEIKYLVHLRSVWFDGDLHYANDYDLFMQRDPETFGWLVNVRDHVTATGRRLNDAPIGSAVLWAPFYAVADVAVLAARWLGAEVERDGFGRPYVWAVCLASLFWGSVGLALIYRTCRQEHARWASQVSTIGIWFATPVVFYLYITPPMAHANSLFAVALFTWLWLRTRQERTAPQWAALGGAAGLMVLVRELNWLMITPLLVEEGIIRALQAVRAEGFRSLQRRLPGQLLLGAVVALVVAPQFLVYRALHGTFSPTPFVVEKFSCPVKIPRTCSSRASTASTAGARSRCSSRWACSAWRGGSPSWRRASALRWRYRSLS